MITKADFLKSIVNCSGEMIDDASASVAEGLAADILGVKHSAYNLLLSTFGSSKRATFVENEDGDYETGFVETDLTPGEDAVNFGLDALNVFSFGRSGGVTGFLAKTPAKSSVVSGVKNVVNKNAGRSGKQARLKELAKDPKIGKADKGWIKNEMRHIKSGNRNTIRLPGNSRKSTKSGKVLAHPRNKRAKDGHSYKEANLQDTDLHKLEHKHGGY